ncbi:hypothetical protein H0H92_003714 [Tricholoma furcatifolium]|nr:hypothetical protein H0H92_003714 [Tricholoma furcatifolium]
MIQAGQTKVDITGLSGSIDTHSVRVSGLGEARLHDVVCTIGASKDASYAPDSPSEIIRLLQVKKQAFESEKRVREHEAELLVSYAKTLSGEHVPPSQMSAFLEGFVEQGRKNLTEISDISEKIIALERQIERETEKSVAKKGNTKGEVAIVLGTDIGTTVDLKLTYIVSNVSWKPTYELHAKTENGKPSPSVALHYRARIVQTTGEDWTNTSMTLSTMSSDTTAKRIPSLLPVKLRSKPSFKPGGLFNRGQGAVGLFEGAKNFAAVQPQQQMARPAFAQPQQHPAPPAFGPPAPAAFGLFGSAPQPQQHPAPGLFGSAAITSSAPVTYERGAMGGFDTVDDDDVFEDISPLADAITEPTTFVNETPVAVSFSITGQSTVPSDGVEHQVSIAVLPFEAKISYVAIPRIEARVYLQCKVKNSSDYRLLAGPVSVILDDSYVSKTSINDVSTGENFDCTLGDDAATQVIYSRTARTVETDSGSFTEAHNVTTYTTTITVYNKHGFVLPDLVVRDVVPTVDDKRAKVILRKPEGLAQSKDGEEITVRKEGDEDVKVGWDKLVDGKGGEKEGKIAWKASIKAKDKVVLESQWELKAPADTRWHESVE